VEGLDVCFYPIIESLDAPRRSARHVDWIEGERLAFGFFEVPGGYDEPEILAPHEMFFYILSGRLQARSDDQTKSVGSGDIVHVPKGVACRLQVQSPFARYVLVCSTPYLEKRIDGMSPDEAEQARLHIKPN
jgi:mannose-6-phosphate isomerase-like protein (cupin superfamily)